MVEVRHDWVTEINGSGIKEQQKNRTIDPIKIR